jgi:hypothetical protein
MQKADSRSRGYFYVRMPEHAFSMAGLGGDIFGCAGLLLHRFANPALCPPPHLAMGKREINRSKRSHTCK